MTALPRWPVTITHVDVAEITAGPTRALGEGYLCVFWRDDAPVGQIYGTSGPGELVRLDELAVRAGAGPWHQPSTPKPHTIAPTVSVVICTRDRPRELARCLASLPRQTRVPDQILVVDNGSQGDETWQAAVAAGVDYVRETRTGLDIARNTGALRANGDIIAYTDDDVELHPRWLERLVGAFDDDHVWAVTGLVLPAELETEAQCIFEGHWGFARGFARRDHGSTFYRANRSRGCPVWEIGAGANMAFRRWIFDGVGLFDERLDVGAAGCSGDSEFWYRILYNGGTCRYEPSAVVFHYHRRDYDALARQIRAYMSGHAAALLVQYERTRDFGNLRRLLWSLPRRYAGQFKRRLLYGPDYTTCLLKEEVVGCLAGVLYYLKAPRPKSPQQGDQTAFSALHG
jgi:glycosyltransferase involved in cell wall biosynthesis